MGEKVLFLGLKNGGNRVLFSNLAWGGAAVAPLRRPDSPLPAPRAPSAPAQAPGARGASVPGRGEAPLLALRPLPGVRPAPTARPGLRRPSSPPHPEPRPPAGLGRAEPNLARSGPRLRLAAQLLGRPDLRPAASREAANMAPGVTQSPPPSLAAGHRHALLRERTPAGRGAQGICFPLPHCLPRTAAGTRGRQS